MTPCTTVCFSGPTSSIAGPQRRRVRRHRADDFNEDGIVDLVSSARSTSTSPGSCSATAAGGFGAPRRPLRSGIAGAPPMSPTSTTTATSTSSSRPATGAGLAPARQRLRRIRGADHHHGCPSPPSSWRPPTSTATANADIAFAQQRQWLAPGDPARQRRRHVPRAGDDRHSRRRIGALSPTISTTTAEPRHRAALDRYGWPSCLGDGAGGFQPPVTLTVSG